MKTLSFKKIINPVALFVDDYFWIEKTLRKVSQRLSISGRINHDDFVFENVSTVIEHCNLSSYRLKDLDTIIFTSGDILIILSNFENVVSYPGSDKKIIREMRNIVHYLHKRRRPHNKNILSLEERDVPINFLLRETKHNWFTLALVVLASVLTYVITMLTK